MKYKQNLKFQEIYDVYLCANNDVSSDKYIENYKEIIYDLLKIAMYKNFQNKKVTNENIKKIIDYCKLIINYPGMPKAVVEAFLLILEDYKYLLITNNINYFFNDYYELKDSIERSNVYLEDIIQDIKQKVKLTANSYMMRISILENKCNVLDSKLLNVFKKSLN